MIEKHKVLFLLDSRARFSVIPFFSGPRSNSKVSIPGISGQLLERCFTQPLACAWGDLPFCHSFFPVLEIPNPLLERDLPSKFNVQILLPPPQGVFLYASEKQADPPVWTDGSTIRRMLSPVWVHLKDPFQFPHQKQHPLNPEAWRGLLPIINNLKQQGLLVKCSSPYNSPILAVQKGPIWGDKMSHV
jgi:hypothetical protein